MQRLRLVALVLGISSTVASAESRLVVGAPTPGGWVLGRHAVGDTAVAGTTRAQSRTVYLNRHGITVTPGPSDARINRSSIVSAQSTVPAWDVGSAVWSQTVTCLREMFASYDVLITETDPGAIPHIEAVFGGSPANLGLPGNMAGVSPFSSSCKVIESSIVFTFTDVIPQNAVVACEIMAQEIAHSYGLDHELLASDPMSYLAYSGRRAFQDQTAPCGESSPRPCGLTGSPACRQAQNSHALLLERIGKAGTGDVDAPTVAITSPASGAVVEPGFVVTANIADDVLVKFASLAIDGEPIGSLTAAPWSFTTPADLGPGTHVIDIKATDGAHETIATIEVTIRGEPESDSPIGGCSSSSGDSWLLALLVAGLICIQRRAQR